MPSRQDAHPPEPAPLLDRQFPERLEEVDSERRVDDVPGWGWISAAVGLILTGLLVIMPGLTSRQRLEAAGVLALGVVFAVLAVRSWDNRVSLAVDDGETFGVYRSGVFVAALPYSQIEPGSAPALPFFRSVVALSLSALLSGLFALGSYDNIVGLLLCAGTFVASAGVCSSLIHTRLTSTLFELSLTPEECEELHLGREHAARLRRGG